jgi:hypothetical protein
MLRRSAVWTFDSRHSSFEEAMLQKEKKKKILRKLGLVNITMMLARETFLPGKPGNFLDQFAFTPPSCCCELLVPRQGLR